MMSGTCAGLNGRGDARLEIVGVDRLHGDVDLGLTAVLSRLASQLDVPFGNEVHPLEEMKLRGLSVGGCGAGREDPFQASGGRNQARCAADLQDGSTV